jgi:hypothetical protein
LRTADAELFHALDQRGFGEARRRLGEMLGRGDRALRKPLALAHRRQAFRLIVLGGLVLAFLIKRQEAVELDHGAGCAQIEHPRADLCGDIDGRPLELGRLHLARHRAQPDELVELGLIGLEELGDIARAVRHVGRPHGFVRFLRGLLLVLIIARRFGHILPAVVRCDVRADRADRFRRHEHAVGTHIGNETDRLAADVDAFVQALRDAHGVSRRKAELAACLLLHG